jgi:outer membrane murein-binding lipoprotein Lpp
MVNMIRQRMLVGVVAVMGVAVSGCDYWPPALQAQVEQLRSEVQTVNMEKAQLQNQINDLSKGKQDLQTQVDDLSRMNREKTAMISSLQNQVDTLRAKAVKAMAPKAPVKATAKPAAKPAAKTPAKTPAKKKVPAKRT